MTKLAIEFIKNDPEGNTLSLVRYSNLKNEKEVPMISFKIEVNGVSTGLIPICDGEYNSGLFLLYLAELAPKDPFGHRNDNTFLMNPRFKNLTTVYFGDDLCNDAKNNPQTKYTTVRDLLTDGGVIVHINYKD